MRFPALRASVSLAVAFALELASTPPLVHPSQLLPLRPHVPTSPRPNSVAFSAEAFSPRAAFQRGPQPVYQSAAASALALAAWEIKRGGLLDEFTPERVVFVLTLELSIFFIIESVVPVIEFARFIPPKDSEPFLQRLLPPMGVGGTLFAAAFFKMRALTQQPDYPDPWLSSGAMLMLAAARWSQFSWRGYLVAGLAVFAILAHASFGALNPLLDLMHATWMGSAAMMLPETIRRFLFDSDAETLSKAGIRRDSSIGRLIRKIVKERLKRPDLPTPTLAAFEIGLLERWGIYGRGISALSTFRKIIDQQCGDAARRYEFTPAQLRMGRTLLIFHELLKSSRTRTRLLQGAQARGRFPPEWDAEEALEELIKNGFLSQWKAVIRHTLGGKWLDSVLSEDGADARIVVSPETPEPALLRATGAAA